MNLSREAGTYKTGWHIDMLLFWDALTRFGVEKNLWTSAVGDKVTLTRLRSGVRALACDSTKVASDLQDAILIF